MVLSNITIQLIWGWSRDSPGGLRQTAPFDWDGHDWCRHHQSKLVLTSMSSSNAQENA